MESNINDRLQRLIQKFESGEGKGNSKSSTSKVKSNDSQVIHKIVRKENENLYKGLAKQLNKIMDLNKDLIDVIGELSKQIEANNKEAERN